jgi:bacterioferritin
MTLANIKRVTNNRPVMSDVQAIRDRAREQIEDGAVTSSYPEDKATIVRLLNEALATELVCVLRYKRHYYVARGTRAKMVAAEFLEHAKIRISIQRT